MSLTDLMSRLELATFPQIALVIFLVLFATILARVFRRTREEDDRASQLPLNDSFSESQSLSRQGRTP